MGNKLNNHWKSLEKTKYIEIVKKILKKSMLNNFENAEKG